MKNSVSKFKLFDHIKVINNTKDPDFNHNISHWSGYIEEIEFENGIWVYLFELDDDTLNYMVSNDIIQKCKLGSLDSKYMRLEEKYLKLLNS